MSLSSVQCDSDLVIGEYNASPADSRSLRSTPSTDSLDGLEQPLTLETSSYKEPLVIIKEVGEDKTPWSTLEYELSNGYFQKSQKVVVQNYDKSTDGVLLHVTPSDRTVVAVIGTGYVGYNLVTVFGAHYEVLAFDVSVKRIEEISKELMQFPLITPTSNPNDLSRATHFLIAVPTQILPNKKIDTSCVEKAVSTIDCYARPGATVVMESSVAIGMTRALLEPLMRSRNLKAGMSPERVDPGRTSPSLIEIPKLISGLDDITPGSLDSISELYSKVFRQLVPVSCPEVAEMTKLYENCQRMVNIAYANEMADACREYGISAFEVCSAALTKPFGYQPMTPSLGVGGHCIPVNPFYLFSSSRRSDTFPLLRMATETMLSRPATIGDQIMTSLFKSVEWRSHLAVGHQPRALVCGVGFKPGQNVLSNSPGYALLKHLNDAWVVTADYVDPLVNQEMVPLFKRLNDQVDWTVDDLQKYDVIIVAIRQVGLDFGVLESLASFGNAKTKVQWCCP